MVVPKKSLSQHFLRDDNIVRKIVASLAPKPSDAILEIGPGRGVLTRQIWQQVRHFVAVEVDDQAIALLRELFGPALTILRQDVREVRLASLASEYQSAIRVVGNIPYHITSDILFWLFDQQQQVADATLMLQFEVARRLTAEAGGKEYGILSVVARLFSEPALLFRVSPHCFWPEPSVESAVVRLDFRTDVPAHDHRLFRAIVRGTFGKRRKMLSTSLKHMGFRDQNLRQVTLDLHRRPEDLALEEFLELTRQLEPYRDQLQDA